MPQADREHEEAVTELDLVTASSVSRDDRVSQLLTAVRATHARYKAKCAEVAELRAENKRLREEVRRWKAMMVLHSEIISLTEEIVRREAQQ